MIIKNKFESIEFIKNKKLTLFQKNSFIEERKIKLILF